MPARRSFRLDDLTDAELVYVLREYVPDSWSMIDAPAPPPHECGFPLWEKTGGVLALVEKGHARGDPPRRGRPSAPRYFYTDDFYPVLERVAHRLAWRVRQGRAFDGLPRAVAFLALIDPKAAVPQIIESYRGLSIENRGLDKYRRFHHQGLGSGENRDEEIERAVRFFLVMRPPTFMSAKRLAGHQKALDDLDISSSK